MEHKDFTRELRARHGNMLIRDIVKKGCCLAARLGEKVDIDKISTSLGVNPANARMRSAISSNMSDWLIHGDGEKYFTRIDRTDGVWICKKVPKIDEVTRQRSDAARRRKSSRKVIPLADMQPEDVFIDPDDK